MSAEFSYDPVTAVDETSATGETAAIFADIRATMGIPLITSIWRGLADMGEALRTVWDATKPIYLSGHTEGALTRVVEQSGLPLPQPLAPTQLACIGVNAEQLTAVRTIVNAYNRSNGMNMVALAALVSPQSGKRAAPIPRKLPAWTAYPPLMPREAIDDDIWGLVRHVNAFGAPGIDAHVATLWRHLAHWPSLLALIQCGFAPLQADGSITAAARRMIELTRKEAVQLAAWREQDLTLSPQEKKTIEDYVSEPELVARMVTIGHALAGWLPRN